MPSLLQYVYSEEGNSYRYGFNGAVPEVEIFDAPEDADFSRTGITFGNDTYSLFCFKGHSRDTLYSFNYDADVNGYKFTETELTITNAPEDIDAGGFDVSNDDSKFRFYFKRLGNTPSVQLYQFILNADENILEYAADDSLPVIDVVQYPNDADFSRFFLYNDGDNYVLGCAIVGSKTAFYSGAFNGEAYQFAHKALGTLTLEDSPDDVTANCPAMLHDGSAYRFYYVKQ